MHRKTKNEPCNDREKESTAMARRQIVWGIIIEGVSTLGYFQKFQKPISPDETDTA